VMLLACPHMVDATACLGWGGVGWDDNVNSSRVFGVTVRDRRQINLHEFGTVEARNFGKPPTESLAKFESRKLQMQLTRGAPW